MCYQHFSGVALILSSKKSHKQEHDFIILFYSGLLEKRHGDYLRIISGTSAGRKLTAPKGEAIRPTSDRVKAALFDILGDIEGLRVLDLFGGTGGLAIESLSRNARYAVVVDKAKNAVSAIRRNMRLVDETETRHKLMAMDAFRAVKTLAKEEATFELVLLDPPYAFEQAERLFAMEAFKAILSERAQVIYECSKRGKPPIPEGWEIYDERNYGETMLLFIHLL